MTATLAIRQAQAQAAIFKAAYLHEVAIGERSALASALACFAADASFTVFRSMIYLDGETDDTADTQAAPIITRHKHPFADTKAGRDRRKVRRAAMAAKRAWLWS